MAFMAKAKIKDYYPHFCEVNSWWMNSAAIQGADDKLGQFLDQDI